MTTFTQLVTSTGPLNVENLLYFFFSGAVKPAWTLTRSPRAAETHGQPKEIDPAIPRPFQLKRNSHARTESTVLHFHNRDWQQADMGSSDRDFPSRELSGMIPDFGHRPDLPSLAADNG